MKQKKEQQIKPKVSRKKKIIKIRRNKIETEKQQKRSVKLKADSRKR